MVITAQIEFHKGPSMNYVNTMRTAVRGRGEREGLGVTQLSRVQRGPDRAMSPLFVTVMEWVMLSAPSKYLCPSCTYRHRRASPTSSRWPNPRTSEPGAGRGHLQTGMFVRKSAAFQLIPFYFE